jgi:hypothetical protein
MRFVKILFALLLGVALTGALTPAAHAAPQITIQWHEPAPPPGHWSNAWHQGFHAGARAAHHDIARGLPPDPRRHADFRHPDVPPGRRHDFRDGFLHGYHMVYNRDWHRGH